MKEIKYPSLLLIARITLGVMHRFRCTFAYLLVRNMLRFGGYNKFRNETFRNDFSKPYSIYTGICKFVHEPLQFVVYSVFYIEDVVSVGASVEFDDMATAETSTPVATVSARPACTSGSIRS
jgi:hypothetical protein